MDIESILSVKELGPGGSLIKELQRIAKEYGVECQLIVGAKNGSWASSYEGKGKTIKQLVASKLRDIFLVSRPSL